MQSPYSIFSRLHVNYKVNYYIGPGYRVIWIKKKKWPSEDEEIRDGISDIENTIVPEPVHDPMKS